MGTSLGKLLSHTSKLHSHRCAVAGVDGEVTYGDLDRMADQVAAGLAGLGLLPGDRILLWLENGWRWAVAYYGILRLGAVVVPANALLTPAEVDFMLADSGSRAVLAPSARLPQLANSPRAIAVATAAGSGREPTLDGFFQTRFPLIPTRPATESRHDLAAICYTSGTAGYPKGAMLRHESLVLSATMTGLMHGRRAEDVIASALPFSHVYGSMVLNSAVAVGATVVTFPRFEESSLLAAIERRGVTILEGTPSSYLALLGARDASKAKIGTLRLCTVGGQGMAETSMRAVEHLLTCRLVQLWGMTEIGGPGTTQPYNAVSPYGSIGIPLPLLDVKVVDPDDPEHEVPDLGTGELLVRGPQVMTGYLDRAEESSRSFVKDRWMRTGDLVCRHVSGHLYLVDRIKNVILSGGYTIYPAEIERVLAEHRAVLMAAVVPQEDHLRGQVGKAFVRLRAGASCNREELLAHCRLRLARYKVPRAIEFVDNLPCTATGKLLKRALMTGEGWSAPPPSLNN